MTLIWHWLSIYFYTIIYIYIQYYYINRGGAITYYGTVNEIYNVVFENNFSKTYGGSILFFETYSNIMTYAYFYNSTSAISVIYILLFYY